MKTETKRPNILFILSDDQGAWALGCSGNPEIQTPTLDRLAERGIRFENFFCASPVCSPARASLLTGRIPSQHGIHDYLSGGHGIASDVPLEYLAGQKGYTDFLAENGYVCGLSGKWHLGANARPQKGHSHWYAHQKGGGPYYNAPMFRNGEPVNEPGYITDLITDDALAFLEAQAEADAPFYLGLHYTAPHSPWIDNHPQEWLDLYRDCAFDSCPQETPHPWAMRELLADWFDNPRPNLQGYFAAVSAMDAAIGRVLALLEKQGKLENTLVCFTSDNGFNCGHHGVWGKGNGTFPLNLYDSSVKVPLILSHPVRLPQGAVCETPLSAYDFMPSLLDYVGIVNPEAETLPGRSFIPLLESQMPSAAADYVVVFDEYGPARMIRERRFKYIHRYPYGPHELYDLENDPNERENLYGVPAFAAEQARLKAGLDAWFARYANPEIDGAHEAVLGGGQSGLAGVWGAGETLYSPNNSL